MKRAFAFLLAAAVVPAAVSAQMNPRGVASMEGGKITADYGKPSAKGRDVFSMIVPGSYWRMGADNATKLKTEVPLLIGPGTVQKGEYELLGQFTSPEEFQLIVASGMAGDEPSGVVTKVKGEISKGHDHVEQMTIALEGKPSDAHIVLSWAGSRIRMPVRIAP